MCSHIYEYIYSILINNIKCIIKQSAWKYIWNGNGNVCIRMIEECVVAMVNEWIICESVLVFK